MITKYTRSQVREAREKWITFQSTKGRQKATNMLDFGGGKRCCLGHACYALGIPKIKSGNDGKIYYGAEQEESAMPQEGMEMLGLFGSLGEINSIHYIHTDDDGDTWKAKFGKFYFSSLADLNDDYNISAPMIGKYLLTVIEGGEGTPFLALSEYPETL